MGDYVYFRFTGKVKKEYKKDLYRVLKSEDKDNGWREFGEKYEWAKGFTDNSEIPYPSSIPFAPISAYNRHKNFGIKDSLNFTNYDDEYYDENDDEDEAFIWQFACDPEWGEGIEEFLRFVAPKICEEYVSYVWSEYDDFPKVTHYKEQCGTLDENSFKDANKYKTLLEEIDNAIKQTTNFNVKMYLIAIKSCANDDISKGNCYESDND